MKLKILLVEDDQSLGETLFEVLSKKNLEREAYLVHWCQTIAQAKKEFQEHSFDLMILDVGLPDGSGFDFAKETRKIKMVPLIFMTALNTAENRLEGYEIGADEYIPKPFHLKELLLRVQHVLDNHKVLESLQVGKKRIDWFRQSIVDENQQTELLSKRDFLLLKLLVEASPRILSRDEILDQVWGEDRFPSQRTIDNSIVRLRQALGDQNALLIKSVRGVGYQWNFNKNEF